jgi:hypothetical protein
MEHHYQISTSISGRFDPEVEGETLSSICKTCDGYISHSIPFNQNENVVINLTLNGELNDRISAYLIGQLETEFGGPSEGKVVQRIQEVSSMVGGKRKIIRDNLYKPRK